jgi:diacylglycerol kinase
VLLTSHFIQTSRNPPKGRAGMKRESLEPGRRAASRLASFRHAFAGWWYVLRTQRNAWIHAVASILACALSLWLQLQRLEWTILLLIIALVWVAECVNTAVEAVVDLLSPDIHPLAKIAKDVAAAAVLIAVLAAVAIGLLILGPPLWTKLSR